MRIFKCPKTGALLEISNDNLYSIFERYGYEESNGPVKITKTTKK